MADFTDIFARVNNYTQQQQNGGQGSGGLGGYQNRLQGVRDAYYDRLARERWEAQMRQMKDRTGALWGAMGGGQGGGGGGTFPGGEYNAFMSPDPGDVSQDKVKSYVRDMAAKRGWTGGEWNALHDLIQRESSWNYQADNPTSTAWGLFQFLASTSKNYGISHGNASLHDMVDAGLRYIADRYQTPTAALNHWLAAKPINGKNVGHWY